jgi:hypothetical protein
MTSREKRFRSIVGGGLKTYRFADIRNFLEYHGFCAEMKGGSHCTFRRKLYPHITIVMHHGHVKGCYVRRAVQILKDFDIIK